MMDLILDIGNTHTKAALFLNDGIHMKWVWGTEDQERMNDLWSYSPQRILMSSSSGWYPDLPDSWKKSQVLIFDSKTPVPVENLYLTPDTLGRDRLAAALGSAFLFPGKPVLSIDCGTCVTFDFINEKRQYLGGSISPGLQMRFKALHHFTGKLPLTLPGEDTEIPGKTTEEAIRTGVQKGMIYEIEGQIDQYRLKNPELIPLMTGGDARYFVNRLKYEIFANQNLVLIGLHQILKHNDQ